MLIQSILIFLGLLFMLVVIHEFGHFIFAKLFKVRVDEFAFGFPPRLFSFKKGDTVYAFNMIPLGGYVRIFGENGLDGESSVSREDIRKSFTSKSAMARIIILSGGVLFNLIACVVFFALSFYSTSKMLVSASEARGYPASSRELVVASLHEKSNLRQLGMKEGAALTALSVASSTGEKVLLREELFSDVFQATVASNTESIFLLSFVNPDSSTTTTVQVVPQAGLVPERKILGLSVVDEVRKDNSVTESLWLGLSYTSEKFLYVGKETGSLIKSLVFGGAEVSESLSGPVGIAAQTKDIASRSLAEIFYFAGALSLSLAVFNILPIPALDGGRIVFVLVGSILKKKVSAEAEQLIHGLGFLFLLGLMVFVTYFDILKIFNK